MLSLFVMKRVRLAKDTAVTIAPKRLLVRRDSARLLLTMHVASHVWSRRCFFFVMKRMRPAKDTAVAIAPKRLLWLLACGDRGRLLLTM